jgi:DNA-binding transcriptional MerR regulator
MSTTTENGSETRLHTIGAVCDGLREEFPDISISKIRYLEDQGLLQPKRTRGGYRLFSEHDVERLVTILRLQRDAFLPLKVIKEELAAQAPERARRRAVPVREQETEIDLGELVERSGVTAAFARELEEYDLLSPRIEGGERYYPESDADIASMCARIAQNGVDARHLRAYRTAAARQSALIEQLVAPGLRSRDPERRRVGLEELEALTTAAQELARLLLTRDLREVANR